LEDENPATAKINQADYSEDIYVDDEQEAAFKRREEEEESGNLESENLENLEDSEEAGEEAPADKDHADEEEEQDDNEDDDEDELEIVQVIPQKRKNGKDTKKKPTSKLFYTIRFSSTFSKLSSERVNRGELEEDVEKRKITYNLAIFSLAELAKPQARREPVACFFVLPSNLEWPNIHAQLKIKAGDVYMLGRLLLQTMHMI
jgi:hypothetical protein